MTFRLAFFPDNFGDIRKWRTVLMQRHTFVRPSSTTTQSSTTSLSKSWWSSSTRRTPLSPLTPPFSLVLGSILLTILTYFTLHLAQHRPSWRHRPHHNALPRPSISHPRLQHPPPSWLPDRVSRSRGRPAGPHHRHGGRAARSESVSEPRDSSEEVYVVIGT
jgi:hypothetical protein